MREILLGYGWFTSYYVLVANLIFLTLTVLSFKELYKLLVRARYSKFESLSGSEYVPPISILVPAYNEELTIIQSVKSFLSLDYPLYEVLVSNDGSKDKTLEVLIKEFGLKKMDNIVIRKQVSCTDITGVYHNPKYPKLFVIDKPNGGKADSLNAAINLSHYPLVASVDADSLLERDALIRIAKTYMENPEEIVALGGNVKIANNCVIKDGVIKQVNLPKNLLPLLQNLEYISSFLCGRIGWSTINGLLIVSGAFGVFKKEYIIKVAGYRDGYPGEDMNIIIKLHRYMIKNKLKYKIVFCPDAICWTQAPNSFKILGTQRKRWGRGTLQNMLENKDLFLNPKYKVIGMISVPFTVFFAVFEPYFKITGLLAIIGYCFYDMTTSNVLIAFMTLNILISFLLSLSSLMMEEIMVNRFPKVSDITKMAIFSMLKTIGYPQLCALWSLNGHVQLMRKNNSWGTMPRESWIEDSNSSEGSSS